MRVMACDCVFENTREKGSGDGGHRERVYC